MRFCGAEASYLSYNITKLRIFNLIEDFETFNFILRENKTSLHYARAGGNFANNLNCTKLHEERSWVLR